MKNIITFFTILFFSLFYSQKGYITYGFVTALGIGNAKAPENYSILVFNKQLSYYITAKESLEKGKDRLDQKSYTNDNDEEGTIYNGTKMSKEGDQVVNHLAKKTMWSNLWYRKQVYVKEIAPQINWKIEKETKKIGKFLCNKATATFRGRQYTVWYTPEIPLPYGPWKLQGLPGLILEAYDSNKFVYWYSKTIEYPSNTKEAVEYLSIPINDKFITYQQFKTFQKQELEKIEEKAKIMNKQFPEVEFSNVAKLKDMFIECE